MFHTSSSNLPYQVILLHLNQGAIQLVFNLYVAPGGGGAK